MHKPSECDKCPFKKGSTGFVKDFCPRDPKIAVMLKMPGREELVNGSPMSGKAGRYW
jgi:uracil-DNA glycosylase